MENKKEPIMEYLDQAIPEYAKMLILATTFWDNNKSIVASQMILIQKMLEIFYFSLSDSYGKDVARNSLAVILASVQYSIKKGEVNAKKNLV